MTRTEARKRFTDYCRDNGIPYKLINETGKLVPLDAVDTVYLSCKVRGVIGDHIETSVRFMDEYCYCMSYYCIPLVDTKEKAIKAARMVSYMNTNLEWNCNSLFEHHYFLCEEDGDIYNGVLIRYELLDLYFYEAMDHILNFTMQQIADVFVPVIQYLHGTYSYEDFKDHLKDHIIR